MKTRILTLCMIFGIFTSGAFGQDQPAEAEQGRTIDERMSAANAKRKAGDTDGAKADLMEILQDEELEIIDRAKAGEKAILISISDGATDRAVTDQLEELDSALPDNPRSRFTRLFVQGRQDLVSRRVVSAEEKLTEACTILDENGKRHSAPVLFLGLAKKRQRKFAEASALFADRLLMVIGDDGKTAAKIDNALRTYLKCSAGRVESETVLKFLREIGLIIATREGDEWLPVMQRIVNAQEVVR